jgi:hypothetical protein
VHALALEADRQRQLVGRQAEAVVGPVDPGRGVGLAAGGLDDAIELAGRQLWVWPNIRCSNRCASPVLPGSSWREPTRNQVWYDTIGALASTAHTTPRPLPSRQRRTASRPIAPSASSVTPAGAVAIARFYQARGDPHRRRRAESRAIVTARGG